MRHRVGRTVLEQSIQTRGASGRQLPLQSVPEGREEGKRVEKCFYKKDLNEG